MSELTSYYYYEDRVITPATHQYRVYHADEADKVIADLEESHKMEVEQLLIEIQRLENLCASYRHDCDNLAIREANALKEIGRDNRVIRHQKYKRCLDKAELCRLDRERIELIENQDITDDDFDKLVKGFYKKWRKRWLELAKKFKEAK